MQITNKGKEPSSLKRKNKQSEGHRRVNMGRGSSGWLLEAWPSRRGEAPYLDIVYTVEQTKYMLHGAVRGLLASVFLIPPHQLEPSGQVQ